MRGDTQDAFPTRAMLPALLVGAWLVRILLAWRGGQYYWPDEMNYLVGGRFADAIGRLDLGAALSRLLETPYHTGFVVVGALAAAVSGLARVAFGASALDPDGLGPDAVGASLLALGSVACIGLVHALARRARASRAEAFLAALLVASSASMTYFSRHLVPYDVSLALGLLAMWIGIGEGRGDARSAACGLVAGCATFTYFGSWMIGGMAIGLHGLRAGRSIPAIVRRAAVAGLSAVTPFALLTVASLLRGQRPYLLAVREFAGTINQGSFSEGWSLPGVYLWAAEHGLLLVWIAGCAGAAWLALRKDEARARCGLWLGAAASIYVLLLVTSTGLGLFVVYGRLARQLVPFLCLATACAFARLAPRLHVPIGAALAGVLFLGGLGLVHPFTMRYPRDAQREALRTIGSVPCSSTIAGCEFTCDYLRYLPPTSRGYVLLNAHILWPMTGSRPAPRGRELFRYEHPESYFPYQCEGYTPQERALLRSTDISMRLIELDGR